MPDLLKESSPVARKEHKCMYCGCIIPVGEKYSRDTLIYDGTVYDWVAHEDCCDVATLLDMFDYCDDDGLGMDSFQEYLDEYLNDHYRDPEIDDLPEHIAKMSRIEQVRMIIADWDKPHIKLPRLKGELYRLKAWCGSRRPSEYEIKRVAELESEIAALEKELNAKESK